jgi:hypothetical protein
MIKGKEVAPFGETKEQGKHDDEIDRRQNKNDVFRVPPTQYQEANRTRYEAYEEK